MENYNILLARHEILLISELEIPIEKTKRISTEITVEINEIKYKILNTLEDSVLTMNDRLNELYSLEKVMQNPEYFTNPSWLEY